ncbi:aldehyde dehydrogenase family protein [Arthrobacter sp. NPDC080031]|uniref:aldehyde dehydrogenase family protein n=1 Tax=Arthrobacter sp. NPDC080031 TaxID=3155918 RepID=UPI00344EFD7C
MSANATEYLQAAKDLREGIDRDWRMLIGGELTGSLSGERAAVFDPATGEQVTTIPRGDEADANRAIDAALAAFPAWAARAITDRAAHLHRLADAIEEAGEELAWIDTIDNGSPIAVMRGDYRIAVEHLRYFAGLALQLRGESIPVDQRDAVDFSVRAPFGVVGRIVPFNHPFMFAASRIAAPLLAGNTVVLKPAEATSLSALRLGEIAAGIFPPGVLNIVSGPGRTVGDTIVRHPEVRRLAFTGSGEVGRSIQAQAASASVKVVTLELGGKNPMIVFPDADFEEAIQGAIRGMNFAWQGQSCGSTSRLYVHRSIYRQFVEELGRRLDLMGMGDPLDEKTEVGPVVSRAQYEKVTSYFHSGIDDGLELIAGGLPDPAQPGNFIRPTLFAAENEQSRLFSEEIFGPVLVATCFDDYDEIIARANALPLGLTASVWTKDLATALKASRDIETGYVWVNWSSSHIPGASFGGVKDSGIGREEGLGELESFTQSKNIYIRF